MKKKKKIKYISYISNLKKYVLFKNYLIYNKIKKIILNNMIG